MPIKPLFHAYGAPTNVRVEIMLPTWVRFYSHKMLGGVKIASLTDGGAQNSSDP